MSGATAPERPEGTTVPQPLRPLLVTHSGTFHLDDAFAFAYAALRLAFGLGAAGVDHALVRTREEAVIAGADVAWDVGAVYDAEANRFDHHQRGAPVREGDGLPYSAAGLVWRRHGEAAVRALLAPRGAVGMAAAVADEIVSIFGDPQCATRATDQVREWVMANLRDLLPDPPEVIAGEALLHKEADVQGGGTGLFAAVRAWDGVGGPKEEVLPLVREHIFPVITGAPGFRGYYTFLDEREASRGVSASLFDTREHAMAAQERVVAAVRERRLAPNPPTVMAGQTAVVAAAES